MNGLLALALMLAAPARAQDASKTIEILSIGGYTPNLSMRFVMPFEKWLREHPEAKLAYIDNVVAVHAGPAYGYVIEEDAKTPVPEVSPSRVKMLENTDGFFAFVPAQPELLEGFAAVARKYPLLPPIEVIEGDLAQDASPKGHSYSLTARTREKISPQSRQTLAIVYHLRVKDKPVDAVFLLKVTGGLGRMASAVEGLKKPASKQVVVSRGNWEFRDSRYALQGRALWEALEKLGLKISGIGRGELKRWAELKAYAKERPDAVRFLSANMSAGDDPPFKPSEIVDIDGIKVAFIGLTRPRYGKYVGRGELAGISISEPFTPAREEVKKAREAGADLVVALSNMDHPENSRLYDLVRGIDLIVADSEQFPAESQDPKAVTVADGRRGAYSPAMLLASEYDGVDRFEVRLGPKDPAGFRRMEVSERQTILDETLADKDGLPKYTAFEYETLYSTEPVIIPSARKIFPEGNQYSTSRYPRLTARDFWTMSATLLAERTRAEIALLPNTAIDADSPGDYYEDEVRAWFGWDDGLVVFELGGGELMDLISEIRQQENRERQDLPSDGRLRMAVGGLGEGDKIHGVDIDGSLVYRVVGTELLLANSEGYSSLGRARNVKRVGDLRETVLDELKTGAKKGWPPEYYAKLVTGRPIKDRGLWILNFRDLSVNVSSTKNVRDLESFQQVPNSRVTGFDQRDVGWTAKFDVDYRYHALKWTNTFEGEFSESRIYPTGQPVVINTPNNRLMFLTMGTYRTGSFPVSWMGRSIGPSLGVQYDGEVRQGQDIKRKIIWSVLPGFEIYDGTFIRSLSVSANLKRDYSSDSQYGVRLRSVAEKDVTIAGAEIGRFQAELWANYFFLKREDRPTDLRLEGDAIAKLQIPIWKGFTLAPFIDFYYYILKVRPISGYSTIAGVSLGFSRIWKPQYEKF